MRILSVGEGFASSVSDVEGQGRFTSSVSDVEGERLFAASDASVLVEVQLLTSGYEFGQLSAVHESGKDITVSDTIWGGNCFIDGSGPSRDDLSVAADLCEQHGLDVVAKWLRGRV